jgi:hypothetical protein
MRQNLGQSVHHQFRGGLILQGRDGFRVILAVSGDSGLSSLDFDDFYLLEGSHHDDQESVLLKVRHERQRGNFSQEADGEPVECRMFQGRAGLVMESRVETDREAATEFVQHSAFMRGKSVEVAEQQVEPPQVGMVNFGVGELKTYFGRMG